MDVNIIRTIWDYLLVKEKNDKAREDARKDIIKEANKSDRSIK